MDIWTIIAIAYFIGAIVGTNIDAEKYIRSGAKVPELWLALTPFYGWVKMYRYRKALKNKIF